MTPMAEARSVKNTDEQEAMRIVGAIGDALHYEYSQFLKPGLTENQVTAFGMKYLYDIPGIEDVEGCHRLLGPERLAQLAQLLRTGSSGPGSW